jgi:GntR family histidine utilization transcriptional repressor
MLCSIIDMSRSLRDSASQALYLEVKDRVMRQILDGSLPPGSRIPSEHELVAEFKISRMTINRALREMADQGILRRVAGVGTFVAEPKAQSGLLQVANLASEIKSRGHRYSCDVVRVAKETSSLEVAAALGIATGDPVFHSRCVHRENGIPVQLEDRYVNPKAAPDFLKQDFSTQLPGEYLLRLIPLDEIEHVVDAVAASKDVAAPLEIKPGEPCLLLTRRTWAGALPVTFVRCTHPGNRYRLGSRFHVNTTGSGSVFENAP